MVQAVFVGEGNQIDYTPSQAVAAGQVVVQGNLVGVAVRPIPAGTGGALVVDGLVRVAKVAGEIAVGVAVFWDADGDPTGGQAGSGAATTVAGGASYLGLAAAGAGAAEATVLVNLEPVASVALTVHGLLEEPIADPGPAGAIPVTASGHCPLVAGATGETRTLAAPTLAGQLLSLNLDATGGGSIAVTVAGGLDDAGHTMATFTHAGETLTLLGTKVGTAKRWRLLANDGTTLSGP